jgi:transcriptional regulator with XRE-family HTH domain
MVEKIKAIISWSGLTAGDFCKKLQIQRSALTHILSGRNNPSLSLVQKILQVFPEINPDWLLLDQGEMLRYNESMQSTLFKIDEDHKNNPSSYEVEKVQKEEKQKSSFPSEPPKTIKLIMIYEDGSYDELIPKKKT